MSQPPDLPDGPPRDDPGWPSPSVRGLAAALIPGLLGRLVDDPDAPVIVTLRRMFLGFVTALVVIGLILAAVVQVPGAGSGSPAVWLLLIAGAMTALAGTDAARRRRIVCAEPARLARQVSAATLLATATANTAALAGFVAAFLADAFWPYLIGLLPTAIGLVRCAPTRRRIRQLDRDLDRVGCEHSVSEVVYALPGDPASPTRDDGTPPPTR